MPTDLPARSPLKPPVPEVDALPGCGLAAYAGLLGFGCILGMVGMFNASYQIVTAEEVAHPRELQPGSEVAVWQMAPMRKAKLAGLTEAPGAWHDESPAWDGSVACALFQDRVVKVDGEVGYTIAYGAVEAIEPVGSDVGAGVSVTVKGAGMDGAPVSFTCHFGPEEGGGRFAAQLQSEVTQAGG